MICDDAWYSFVRNSYNSLAKTADPHLLGQAGLKDGIEKAAWQSFCDEKAAWKRTR